jgi:N6-adenosine-specific RNA methylase IME4
MSHKNAVAVSAVSNPLPFHPAAEVFPMLEGDEFKALTLSIKENGLRDSIRLQDGKIIDGRARYQACCKLGIEPTFETVPEDVDPHEFVTEANILRRHLTVGQRAMVGAKLATLKKGANQHTAGAASSQEVVARRMGVSVDTLQRAGKILERGCDRLIDAVMHKSLAIQVAADVADYEPEDQAVILAEGVSQARMSMKRFERKKTQVLDQPATVKASKGIFPVIYADPPWRYGDSASSPVDPSNHYPTMKLDAIKAFGVKEIAEEDAVLFLWSPSSFVADAIGVMKAWGFEYVTQAIWDKGRGKQAGGSYFLQRHETLLVGKRGKGLAKPEMQYESVIQSERRNHSQKPEIVYDMLDKMYPDVKKIELFSRNQPARALWTYDGNEANVAEVEESASGMTATQLPEQVESAIVCPDVEGNSIPEAENEDAFDEGFDVRMLTGQSRAYNGAVAYA